MAGPTCGRVSDLSSAIRKCKTFAVVGVLLLAAPAFYSFFYFLGVGEHTGDAKVLLAFLSIYVGNK